MSRIYHTRGNGNGVRNAPTIGVKTRHFHVAYQSDPHHIQNRIFVFDSKFGWHR
jgi:hypothetical protein